MASAIEAAGAGTAGSTATSATAPRTASPTPTGTCSSSTTRPSATSRRRAPAPSLKNQPQRYTGRGVCVKRLDHVNLLAADVRAAREFATDVLGYRLYERIELDDGTEAGAWMSLSIAAHELIYTQDAPRARTAACTTSRSGSTRARSACARPTSSSTTTSTSRPRRPSTRSRRASSSTAYEPGRQPDRGHDRRPPRLRPRRADGRLDAGRAREGAGLGRQDDRELPHLRHAAGRMNRGLHGGRMRIAVLGLGEAGSRLAADLEAAGAVVAGYDPDPVRGTGGAADVVSAVAGSDIVLSVNAAPSPRVSPPRPRRRSARTRSTPTSTPPLRH